MTAAQNNSPSIGIKDPKLWLGLLLLTVLALWAQAQFQLGLNTNATWLSTAAQRLLEGKDAAQDFYETNPPLSILLYLPVALSIKIFGISKPIALFGYSTILTFLSIIGFRSVLRANTDIGADISYVLLYGYILAVTLLPGFHFGDREHIVMLGVFPLGLYLASYTHTLKLSLIKRYSLLLLCSIAILVKPQFLLVPGLFFLHRLYTVRSLKVLFEPPYMVIAAVALTYIGITLAFFQSYIGTILPDMLFIYSGFIQEHKVSGVTIFLGLLNLAIFMAVLKLKHKNKNIAVLVFLAGFVGLLSFYLQNKGFYYHLIPFFQCFGIGAALLITMMLQNDQRSEAAKNKALMLVCLLLIAFNTSFNKDYISPILYPEIHVNQYHAPHFAWPSHEDNKNTPLVELIKTHAENSSYFIMASMPMVIMPSAYSNSELASRFAVLWFLPFLIHSEAEKTLPEENLNTYKIKYADMIAEDFNKYEPGIIILEDDIFFTATQKDSFSFGDYFSISPAFKSVWSNYYKAETVELNIRDYYGGYNYGNYKVSGKYSVYLRKDAPKQ